MLLRYIIPVLLLFVAIVLMGYCLPREAFGWQLASYGVAFSAYLWLIGLKENQRPGLIYGIVLALLLRMVLLGAWPVLSDDFFRFVFDGQLLAHGINPYLELPQQALDHSDIQVNEYWQELLDKMNSYHYFSLYPPLHQVFFWLSALVGENLFANVLVLRLVIIFFEGVNLYLIYRLLRDWQLPVSGIWLYAFNPLVIMELTGNLHFEGLVLTGLLASLYFYGKANQLGAAFSWTWAVGIKLSPLMLGPSWLMAWRKPKLLVFAGLSFLFTLCFLLPITWQGGEKNFYQSFRLYQSSFEFNASIYYLIRGIWGSIVGYNPIGQLGPLLNIMAFFGLLWISFTGKINDPKKLAEKWVWVYLLFLGLQTTVHPWYLVPAFGISVLTQNKIFLVWSGLVFLSYDTYSNEGFKENMNLVMLEYGLLLVFVIWTLVKKNKPFPQKLL